MPEVSVTVTARLASTARVAASTSPSFANATFSGPVAIDPAYGYARCALAGLEHGTKYWVAVELDGQLYTDRIGQLTTPNEWLHSFSFAAASCARTSSNALSFDNIAQKAESGDISFFIHLGDMHYRNISNNDVATFNQAYSQVVAQARQNRFYRSMPVYYMWDDHDFGPNNTGASNPSREAATTAYRQRVPSVPLANVDGAPYYSFTRGRVRFVVLDVRSEASDYDAPDGIDKVIMSAEQLEWMQDQVLAARHDGQCVVLVSSRSWHAGGDGWPLYGTQQASVAEWITTNGLTNSVAFLCGDMHAIAYDDGTNTVGGVRVMQAAALDSNAGATGTWSAGCYADSDSSYGVVDVTDDGGDVVSFRFRGIEVDQSSGAETTRIDVTFDLTP